MTGNGDTGAAPENPFTRPWFIISAVAVLLIIIFGIVVFAVLPSTGSNKPPVVASTGGNSAPASAPADPAASICGLKAGSQTPPATAPRTDWELLGQTAVPADPKVAGPGLVSSAGVRMCFSHDPVGALYAAANVAAMGAEGRVKDVYQYLSADSPARDKLLASNPTGTPTNVTFQIGGYQLLSYTGDGAAINVGISASNGIYLSEALVLQWAGGDWKITLPADGRAVSSQVTNLDGFTAWSGGGD